MSDQIQRFRCELCDAYFESVKELDEHNQKLQQPQPTLPDFESDLHGGAR